jgi:SAM-dependent methyltransferase
MDRMEAHEYDLMYEIEQTYWWYVGRRELAMRLIRRWLKAPGPVELLDIGCGTGGNLLALRRFGNAAGCDIAESAVAYCHSRGLAGVVHQPDPHRLPFPDGRFDLVTAFDMIEHVDDDIAMMREMARVLRPGGAVFLTTPAFPALWSVHDESAHHKRRYTNRILLARLRDAGLEPARVTCLDAFLLPAIVPVRWLRDRIVRPKETTSDFHLKLPGWLNAVFRMIFVSEWAILKFAPLPLGLSLCCLSRKK